ncbi:MAG: CPBP family intramembrane metalloprotease [Mycolicibacterium hassiacum]|jgi:membrane protease YdiL (CAAX protease family)|uniref:CPBP family intramembrane glutamic endopeptidase n=1 Tax=Mycolicibacterium hassiacum TaxID=46351 RepID=UPI0023F827E9|nr:CPBP family intramembrane glutamic endopeptidase [Mycolicibacterium hassiacum]MBX5485399.1 CPBP family intramembrane metalloprotease [Mycolicibacterium hassiacum]
MLVTGSDTRRDASEVAWFVVVTTVVTWLCYLPIICAARRPDGIDPALGLLALTAVLSPTVTACVLATLRGGRAELRRLLRASVAARFALRWYLVVLLVPFAIPLAAVAVDAVVSGTSPAAWVTAAGAQTLATFWIAPLGEDAGWRGYALARMLRLTSPLATSLVLGPLWALWHLPMALVPGTAQADQPFLLFAVQLTGATMIFVRVYLGTGGSVLAMMLMHAAANLAFNTVPVFVHEGGNPARTTVLSLLYLAAGAIALASLGRRAAAADRKCPPAPATPA